jgi:hypothetical protein
VVSASSCATSAIRLSARAAWAWLIRLTWRSLRNLSRSVRAWSASEFARPRSVSATSRWWFASWARASASFAFASALKAKYADTPAPAANTVSTAASSAATAGLRRHHRQASSALLARRASTGRSSRNRRSSSASASADG